MMKIEDVLSFNARQIYVCVCELIRLLGEFLWIFPEETNDSMKILWQFSYIIILACYSGMYAIILMATIML